MTDEWKKFVVDSMMRRIPSVCEKYFERFSCLPDTMWLPAELYSWWVRAHGPVWQVHMMEYGDAYRAKSDKVTREDLLNGKIPQMHPIRVCTLKVVRDFFGNDFSVGCEKDIAK